MSSKRFEVLPLRQVWMRAGVLYKLPQALHDRGAREKIAEDVYLAAQLFRRQRLDEAFCRGGRRAVEFRGLLRGAARKTQGFAFRRHLAHEAHGEPLRGID